MRRGWYNESHRHALAAKGVKTKYYASKRYNASGGAAEIAKLGQFFRRYPGAAKLSVGTTPGVGLLTKSGGGLIRAPISRLSPAPGGFAPRPVGFIGKWTPPTPTDYTSITGQAVTSPKTVTGLSGKTIPAGSGAYLTAAQQQAVLDPSLTSQQRLDLIRKFNAENAAGGGAAGASAPILESPAQVKATLPIERYGFSSETYVAPTQQEAQALAFQTGTPTISKSPFDSSNYVIAEKVAGGVQVTEVKAPFFSATGQKERLKNVVNTYVDLGKSFVGKGDAIRVVPGSSLDVPVVREITEGVATPLGVVTAPLASAKVAKGFIPAAKSILPGAKTALTTAGTAVKTRASSALSSINSKLSALKAKYAGVLG